MDWLNRVWQKAMIRLARAHSIRKVVEPMVSGSLIDRYLAGSSPQSGGERAQELARRRLRSSLFFVGEYVNSRERCEQIVGSTLDMVRLLAGAGLDIHISIDPTAIGYLLDPALCTQNAVAIAAAVSEASEGNPGIHCLMLDMEDESLVDDTIALHNRLRSQGLPVALTLQAYLRRTAEDLRKQIQMGSRVRLVKGAFAAKSSVAYAGRRAVSSAYRELAQAMLAGAMNHPPFYPIFATHDDVIQRQIAQDAARLGLSEQRFEFEMLMGVRPELAASQAAKGLTVRLYVPCGPDWWGYVNRRLGESPRNAVLLLKAICS